MFFYFSFRVKSKSALYGTKYDGLHGKGSCTGHTYTLALLNKLALPRGIKREGKVDPAIWKSDTQDISSSPPPICCVLLLLLYSIPSSFPVPRFITVLHLFRPPPPSHCHIPTGAVYLKRWYLTFFFLLLLFQIFWQHYF